MQRTPGAVVILVGNIARRANMKKNDLVRECGNYSSKGTATTDPTSDGMVEVLWDGASYTQSIHISDLDVIDLVKEKLHASLIQSRIDAVTSVFEIAFNELRCIQVDADNVASLHDLKYADLIDTSKLEKVVEAGGWSSSSLWC